MEANDILKETGLLDKLKRFGEIKQIGSYFLDLMVKPDIDFALRVNKNSEVDMVIEKIREICEGIDNVSFKKITDGRKWGLEGKSVHFYYHGEELWGFDIIISDKDFREYDKLKKKVEDNITQEKKRDILKLKYHFYKNKKKIKNIPYCIYVGVLDGKVSNLEELYEYVGEVETK